MRSNLWSAHLTKLSNRTWNRKYNTPVLFLCVSLNFCDHGVVFFLRRWIIFRSMTLLDLLMTLRIGLEAYVRTRIVAFLEPMRLFFCGRSSFANAKNTPPFFFSCLSLCWNRFLRRMKTKRINTVIKKEGRTCELRPHLPPLFKLTYLRACSPQIT